MDDSQLMRYTCCGNTYHLECYNDVMNSKVPDDLKYRCHHCRKPIPRTDEALNNPSLNNYIINIYHNIFFIKLDH